MYNVSQNYVNQIMSRSITSMWYGTIVTKSNRSYTITDRNIKLSGSKILSHGVSGESLQIGTANSKSLTLQLYLDYDGTNYYLNGIVVDRYDFYEAQVKLTFRLYLNKQHTSYEDVQMPTFIVQEAKRTSDLLTLNCFDFMRKFNKLVEIADNGTAYDMANVACNQCGVELGMTRTQMQSFTNGNAVIFPYEANSYVKSGTSFIGFIGAFICANAYIGNDDKLYFKQYGMTTDRTITSSWRFSSQFADYETHYAVATAKDVTTKKTLRVEVTGDTGLVYEFGTNIFLQYGTDSEKETRLQNILNKLNEITYTPFTVKTPIDPALQVFDVLEFTNNQAVSGKKCCITSIEFNLNGSMSIKGVGEDPNILGGTAKLDDTLTELSNNIDSKTIYFYNFTNSKEIEILDGEEQEICNIRFVTTSESSVIFQLEALIDAETTVIGRKYYDLNVKVTYYLNEIKVDEYYPGQCWVDGKHILHLFYPLDIQNASANHWVVTLHCEGGSVIIPIRYIKSSVYGQSLAASDRWDGTFDIRQVIAQITLPTPSGVRVNGVNDVVSVGTQVPTPIMITDEIVQILLGKPSTMSINGVNDTVEIGFIE